VSFDVSVRKEEVQKVRAVETDDVGSSFRT